MNMHPAFDTFAAPRPTNALGVAGFVCALLGLLTGGHLLSPIGLILSVVALGYRPRGWAVAGLIIGLLGTCGWLIIAVLALAVVATIALGMAGVFFFSQADRIELTTDMAKIAMQAEEYKNQNRGVPPADLSVLTLQTPALTDPWGRPYRYELIDKEPGFDIVSEGPDGVAGTPDDVRLTALETYWKDAGADFKRELEQFERRQGATFQVGPHSRVSVGREGGASITTTPQHSADPQGDSPRAGTQPAPQP